jgi:probable rRNA maturation factor
MTKFAVEVQDYYGVEDFPAERVSDAIGCVLAQHEVEEGSAVTVVITNDDEVRRLNAQFRGVDAPTDILSFPAEALPDEIEGEVPYLGDLIIAYPYASRQAQEAGHALGDDLVLLAIHGTLHLLGYDHDSAANQEAMWVEQAAALAAAGISFDVPRFAFGDDVDS